jgi:hypothetical protein
MTGKIDLGKFLATISYSRCKLSAEELPINSKKEKLNVDKHGVAYV